MDVHVVAASNETQTTKHMTATSTLPEFFSTVKIPSVAKWASDKVKELRTDIMECQGKAVEVRCWMFEGKFNRTPDCFWKQWASEDGVNQYRCSITCHGGQYRGQKATVLISFTEYVSIDGTPLPQ